METLLHQDRVQFTEPTKSRIHYTLGRDSKMGNRVKVLYIAGQGRSGSTILGNTLGQVEGFVHVGEFLEFWGVLISGQVSCGCGGPVIACQMWNDVLKEAYGGRDESLIAQMLKFRNLEARDRASLPALTARGVRSLRRRLAKPLAELERVYCAIQRVFNCEVIVDSSKSSMYASLLQLVDGIDPYIIHLTRDPRAAAYSFLRKRVKDGRLIWTKDINPIKASLAWDYRNSVIEPLSRRLRHRPLHLCYEDFVANPRGSLQRILDLVDETPSSLP